MYDAQTRITLVKQRARQLRMKQEKQIIWGLSGACLACFGLLVEALNTKNVHFPAEISGMYGAVLLHEDVGGYIMVGLLAFIAAVIITILCVRFQEKRRKNTGSRKEDEPL